MSGNRDRDPKTGESYRGGREDSDRDRVREQPRNDYSGRESSSSRIPESQVPRSGRRSVYVESHEYSNRNERPGEKSRLRTPIGEAVYGKVETSSADRHGQPSVYDPGDSGYEARYSEPHSSHRGHKDYYVEGSYNASYKSRDPISENPVTSSTASISPTADILTRDFVDLQVSGEGEYTLRPPSKSGTYHLEPTSQNYPDSYSQREKYVSRPQSSSKALRSSDKHDRTNTKTQDNPTSLSNQVIPQKNQPKSRYIAGTKGPHEKLDKSYFVRTSDWKKFFKVGKVFSTLWTEGLGGTSHNMNPTFISEVRFGQKVFSKVRRFVVVREVRSGIRSVTCLPVTSYDGAGPSKSGIQLSEHGFIYSQTEPPPVENMKPTALKVNIIAEANHLQDPSMINYGKPYTVETNVKVKDVGELDDISKETLLRYWRDVMGDGTGGFGGSGLRHSGLDPQESSTMLVGVGGAAASYPTHTSARNPAVATSPPFPAVGEANPKSPDYGPSEGRYSGYEQQPQTSSEYRVPSGEYVNYHGYPASYTGSWQPSHQPPQPASYDSTPVHTSPSYYGSSSQYISAPQTVSMYSPVYAQTPQLQNSYAPNPYSNPISNQPQQPVSYVNYEAGGYENDYRSQYNQGSNYNESTTGNEEEIILPPYDPNQQGQGQGQSQRHHRSNQRRGSDHRRRR